MLRTPVPKGRRSLATTRVIPFIQLLVRISAHYGPLWGFRQHCNSLVIIISSVVGPPGHCSTNLLSDFHSNANIIWGLLTG